ncbi:FMN-binding negative transcriptional regulator [Vibrio parahaemolyticus]|uniref:FMN-binding negative transcriptional regulator n=1 Tax=Vibrio parahaemolyticus TaxID=670 RepID=UPI003530D06C|nr:FMN-binding negative transcriptional regulator [Vibrio parahaemolyticus]HCG6960976.1 FMN-binding negative transcriptional regulator [Vibrio parahaemolyticus]HCM0791947.1 FMN-binding negative transcriptional regulator [Vibrio parahaemolyticus]
MFIPRKFRQEKIEELLAVIQKYSFATLVAYSDNGMEATHLPVLLESVGETLILKAHIAKANPLWKKVQNGSDVLVIFNGPNCYISPNHYPTKAEHGRAVPTWNYVVVHVKGSISFVTDPDWVYSVIDGLTTKHEAGSSNSWSISDAPKEYIQKMLPAIVGVEIEVNSLEGQWKLSQNQPELNQQGVINGLSSLNEPASQAVASMVRAQVE